MKDLGSIKGAGLPQAAEARLEQWRLRIRDLHASVEANATRLSDVAQRELVSGVITRPDLTPPPTPSGVVVTAGLSFVLIETDAPRFDQGHGYLRTLVYGAKAVDGKPPTFAQAVNVHEFAGKVSSFASEPKTQWHLWVKWLSADGVESAVPAGGTNGIAANTGNDVSKLLEAMQGQVTASALHATLGSRVDLIDGPASLANSVAFRLASEAYARNGADSTLQTHIDGVQASLTSAQGALQANIDSANTARASGDSVVAATVNAVSARLNSGGDVAQSIATAQNTANAAQTSASTAASSINTVQSRLSRVVNYRIVARGNSDSSGVAPGFFHEDGTRLHSAARSHMLVVLNGTTGAEVSYQTYDVYADGANTAGRSAATLAADLNALGTDKVVVLYTYDEPASNLMTGGLPAALKRCGATQATLDRIKFHGAYILVGVPGMGEGSGIERYAGDVAQSLQGWVELQLQLVNGRPVGLAGGAAVPQLVATVQQEASTRASETGYLGAQWTVRMTAGNVAGGFGLSGSSAPGAGGTIDFGVRANRFFVAPPEGVAGVGNIVPFTVQTTPFTNPTTGEVLPAGVYMSAAYIRDLQVALGRFQQAVITSAMIAGLSADKINAGFLDANRIASNSLDASKINTTGLTVRDANGTVIFGSGAGQPNLSNAGAVALIPSANMRVIGATAEKVSGGSNWDGGFRSVEGYVGGAFASAAVGRTDCYLMFGLNTDPASDNSYGSLDFVWYAVGDGSCQIYENGNFAGSFGAYAPGDVFTITYDGSAVRYARNGSVVRTVPASIAVPLYLDSSFYNEGGRLNNLRFGPYGNPSAVQPSNPITAGNASTFIANAAIQTAQIGDAQITNAKISGDIQSDNFAPGSSGWRIRKADGSAEFAAASIRGKLTTNQLEVGSVTANAVTSQSTGGTTLQNTTAVQVLIGPAANNALATLTLNGGFCRVTAIWNGGIAVAKSSTIAFVTCDCTIETLDEVNNVLFSYTNSAYSPQWARASVPIYPNNEATAVNKVANFSFAIQFMISGQTGVRKFRFVLWNFQGVTTAGAPAAPGTTGVITGVGTIIAQEHRV